VIGIGFITIHDGPKLFDNSLSTLYLVGRGHHHSESYNSSLLAPDSVAMMERIVGIIRLLVALTKGGKWVSEVK
jgi:hypothetical protein